jgi:nitrite reductase/ring-hydroxylating ferredoxin subunit
LILLCESAGVPESSSRGFTLADYEVLVVRREGQIHVYRNRCPHRGVALQWQPDQFLDTSASLIRCASHGALFLIETGECVAGPCEGQALTRVICREDQQGIWIDIDCAP